MSEEKNRSEENSAKEKKLTRKQEENKTELILINISGADRSGLTAELTDILSRYGAEILDIGQADIHHTLSLGILFKTDSHSSGTILKELLFKTNALKVQVSFDFIC